MTMAGLAQSSTSIPTEANSLDEITALRLEIDVAKRKIASQDNELTILHNIICQSCRDRFLDALSPPPGNKPFSLHGSADPPLPSPTTPQAASATSVNQASFPAIHAFGVSSHSTREALDASQSPSQVISTTPLPQPLQAGTTSSTAAPHHDPPPRQFGNAEITSALSSSDTNASAGNSKRNSEFPWTVIHEPSNGMILGVTFERAFTHKGQVKFVKFSLDGKYVAVALSRSSHRPLAGRVIVYSTETGKQACHLVEHTKEEQPGVRPVCFSPNGKQVAVGYSDGRITLWIIVVKRVRNTFRAHHRAVHGLDFSPNGHSIVSASGNTVRVWSVRDGSSTTLNNNAANRTLHLCVRFSPNGKYIAAADWDGFLRMWDSRTHQLVINWYGQQKFVTSLAFMPDNLRLVSGGFGGTIRYWDVTTVGDDQLVSTMRVGVSRRFEGHTDSVSSIAIAADGQWLLSASQDGTARLWNISNGTEQCSVHGHPGLVWSVDISPVENSLVIGDSEGQVSLWRYNVMRDHG